MKVFIVSENCPKPVLKMLENDGVVLLLGPNKFLSEPESRHPDMQIFGTGDSSFLAAPGVSETFFNKCIESGLSFTHCLTPISESYPQNTPYNALKTQEYILCKTKGLANEIGEFAVNSGLKIINVHQGYARCTCLYIDFLNTIVTADKGILKSCDTLNIKTFQIPDDSSIILPGLSKGFIGGCSGTDDRGKTVYFCGNIYKYYPELAGFLEKNGISVRCTDAELIDIGGIQVFTL